MRREFEIWLDNQLPSIIAKWIKDEYGYNVKSSFILQLTELEDLDIYKKARENENLVIIISKDGDFPEIIQEHGTPPKLIKLGTGNARNRNLWIKIKDHIPKAIKLLSETSIDIIYIE